MRDKLVKRLSRRLLQLEKETRYPAHPPASPAEAYVSDVGNDFTVGDVLTRQGDE